MNALNTLWRCSTCGTGRQTDEHCTTCGASRGNAPVSMQQTRVDRGNVYHINAPTQFNMGGEIEPEEVTITAPPLAPEPRPVFSWGIAVFHFIATIVVLTTLVVSTLALMQPKKVIYQCPNSAQQ